MAKITQITEIISMPKYSIGTENRQALSFDIISNRSKLIYNIQCESPQEYDKMILWSDSEWNSNLPILREEYKGD
jgi:hypothetical protein